MAAPGSGPSDGDRADTLQVEERGSVRYLTLKRPPANALSKREYAALDEAFSATTAARVSVLRGTGPTFCAGQDLEEAAALTPALIGPHLLQAGGAVAAAARSVVPLVAVVNGPAVGTGALLVALADVVVMRRSAWLSFPEARHGMPIGLSLLSRIVPERVARRVLATGERVPAEQLAALGAVDHLADDEEQLEVLADSAVRALLGLPHGMAEWLYTSPSREARAQAYLAEVQMAAARGTWNF